MPQVRTALLAHPGSARSEGSMGENINHFAGVRMRVIGSGNLDMTLRTQDGVRTQSLTAFTMAATAEISPFRIVTFVTQRAQLQISTNVIDEEFRINRIIVYSKVIGMEYPG